MTQFSTDEEARAAEGCQVSSPNRCARHILENTNSPVTFIHTNSIILVGAMLFVASEVHFGKLLETFWASEWLPRPSKKLSNSLQSSREPPNTPQGVPRWSPGGSQEVPQGSQEAPKRLPGEAQRPQEYPCCPTWLPTGL